jgi:hypothetical protein
MIFSTVQTSCHMYDFLFFSLECDQRKLVFLSDMNKILIRSGFSGIIPILWSFKSFQLSCKIIVGTPDVLGFSKLQKYDVTEKVCKYFDIPALGDNI